MFSYSCEKWSQLPPRSGVETDGGRQSNSVLPTRLAPPTRRAPPELNRAFAPEARRGQRLPFSHPDADHHSHSPRHANRARKPPLSGLAWNRSPLNSGPVFPEARAAVLRRPLCAERRRNEPIQQPRFRSSLLCENTYFLCKVFFPHTKANSLFQHSLLAGLLGFLPHFRCSFTCVFLGGGEIPHRSPRISACIIIF